MNSSPTLGVRGLVGALAAIGALVLSSACSGGDSGGADKVAIVAYSVPKPAYDDLQAAFVKTDAGHGTTFSSSYGASGAQSKSVSNGQDADYVGFSLEPDMTRLVPDVVAKDWNNGAGKGMVSDSVVVFVVRKGNLKGIRDWGDLIRPGVQIVTPDPASSGSAKWNILAAYTQATANGASPAAARDYLTKFYEHTVSRPASGAEATTTFDSGTGDVLLSYENEAIAARQKGADIDYVVPEATFLIENPAAVTKDASPQARKFLAFARSAAGQKIFAANGFRPVLSGIDIGSVKGANDPADPFPTIAELTTVADLGGWTKVDEQFFGTPGGIVTKIANEVG
jgi:sulfate transport system substrate-binding protein